MLARLGAMVIINYRRSRDSAEALEKDILCAGGSGRAHQADVSNPQAVDAMFQFVRQSPIVYFQVFAFGNIVRNDQAPEQLLTFTQDG